VIYTKILPTINTPWSSLDERGEIWSASFSLLKNPNVFLFGFGLSQFEANYQVVAEGVLGRPPLDLNVIQPHNLFLLFVFHYGVLGVFFLLWIMWRVGKNIWKFEKVDILVMSSLMMFYFLIHGMIDTPFYKNDLLFLLILFLSLCVLPEKSLREME